MSNLDLQIAKSQQLVISVFKALRPELLRAHGSVEFTRKFDKSPVTLLDVKVEETLKSELKKSFPDLGFRGEETGASGSKKTYWLVDPIDGTSSFVRGLPFCTNMAALVHDGHVLSAVIYDFVTDTLYTATKGKGAFKNDQKIEVNASRIAPGIALYCLGRQRFTLIKEALDEIGMRAMLPMGAAGHSYAMLAEGKIDGVINLSSQAGLHDNAPGVLLAEEAGAVMLQFDQESGVKRSQFIIGPPNVIEAIERSGLI